jgi:hypothetical protein
MVVGMTPAELRAGEIVQLVPGETRNEAFAGCLMVVTEPKAFGAQGYVQALGARDAPGGQAYYRANWDEMEPTGGLAPWIIARSEDA